MEDTYSDFSADEVRISLTDIYDLPEDDIRNSLTDPLRDNLHLYDPSVDDLPHSLEGIHDPLSDNPYDSSDQIWDANDLPIALESDYDRDLLGNCKALLSAIGITGLESLQILKSSILVRLWYSPHSFQRSSQAR